MEPEPQARRELYWEARWSRKFVLTPAGEGA
jgi:hypothetical protein